ncbi:MAG: hypothetical protein IJ349_09025, partial [Clostridia bacterium]|nr:hypothetical protein [Clostridia bacterium]
PKDIAKAVSFSFAKTRETRGTRSVSGFERDRRLWRKQGARKGVAVKISVPLQGTRKFWVPQEGHGVVRALLPLPKDIAKAVSFSFVKVKKTCFSVILHMNFLPLNKKYLIIKKLRKCYAVCVIIIIESGICLIRRMSQ